MSTTQQPAQPRIITALRVMGLALPEALQRISEWGQGVAQLLSGDLRLGVHAACQIVTAKVATDGSGVGSVTVATRFNVRPSGVVLMDCRDAGGAVQAIPAYGWSWNAGAVTLQIQQSTAVSPVTLTALIVLG